MLEDTSGTLLMASPRAAPAAAGANTSGMCVAEHPETDDELKLALGDAHEEQADECSPGARGTFRSRYIGMLASRGAFLPLPRRLPSRQTVTIFDWDDTLLCTSWLVMQSSRPTSWFRSRHGRPDKSTAAQLASVAECSAKLLEHAMGLGVTVILTNASRMWVEHSAKRWAPTLLPLLEKVHVLSARDCHRSAHPEEMHMWKIDALLELKGRLPDEGVTNLVSLGDSELDLVAAQVMRDKFQHAVLKAVKFLPRPTPLELLAQLKAVGRHFGSVVERAGDVRIDLRGRPCSKVGTS